jgi:hypothetical protein
MVAWEKYFGKRTIQREGLGVEYAESRVEALENAETLTARRETKQREHRGSTVKTSKPCA